MSKEKSPADKKILEGVHNFVVGKRIVEEMRKSPETDRQLSRDSEGFSDELDASSSPAEFKMLTEILEEEYEKNLRWKPKDSSESESLREESLVEEGYEKDKKAKKLLKAVRMAHSYPVGNKQKALQLFMELGKELWKDKASAYYHNGAFFMHHLRKYGCKSADKMFSQFAYDYLVGLLNRDNTKEKIKAADLFSEFVKEGLLSSHGSDDFINRFKRSMYTNVLTLLEMAERYRTAPRFQQEAMDLLDACFKNGILDEKDHMDLLDRATSKLK